MRLRSLSALALVCALIFGCAVSSHAFQDRRRVVRPSAHRAPRRRHVHHSHPRRHPRMLRSGSSIDRRNGQVRNFHDEHRHMDVHHNLAGGRRVSMERADHSRVVAYRHGGYVEHPYAWHGHSYYRRTYYRYGHPWGSHFYAEYRWHGWGFHVWRPAYYYHPGFYIWVGHPWAHVSYRWAWYGSPWYGYYGYYYHPYAYYAGPGEWLTDYAISQDLNDTYAENHPQGAPMGPEDGEAPMAGPPAAEGVDPLMSDEDKDLLDKEIQWEIQTEIHSAEEDVAGAADSDAATGETSLSKIFADPQPHVFLVSDAVDATDDDSDAECALSAGDLLQTNEPPAEGEDVAAMTVISSKGRGKECAQDATVNVSLDDLQEMQNSLRERIHEGMEELQKQQGQNGIPALPADAAGTVNASYTQGAPPPDDGAGADIQQVYGDSAQAEKDVTAEEAGQPAADAGPVEQQAPAPIERR